MLLIDVPCWANDRQFPLTSATPTIVRGLVYACALFLIFFVGTSQIVPFIYFQF